MPLRNQLSAVRPLFALLLLLATATWVLASGCGTDGGAGASLEGGAGDGSTLDGATVDDGGLLNGDAGGGDAGGQVANNCTPPTALVLAPATKSATVSPGGTFTQAYTVTASYAGKPDADVTGSSFFSLSDPGVGTVSSAGLFTWGGNHGGVVTISAKNCGVTATATLTLDVSAVFGAGGDGGVVTDAGGAAAQFAAAPASAVAACAPALVYPPDGVLLPPNMNVIQVHFTEGSPPNNLFEISFTNAITDVRVYTTCTGSAPAGGQAMNGGCVFELSQAEWDFIAQTNRDGDPLTVKVRGLGCDGGNAASSATRHVSFAKEDMVGALYYWASMRITLTGTNYNSGGIFRYDFGVRGQTPDPVLTPSTPSNTTHLCIGCHTISRDGRQMIFDFDDNDSDDEYGDVNTDIYDIAAATPITPILKNSANAFQPGFHTWNRGTTEFLLSDGPGNTATPAGAFARVSSAGAQLGFTQAGGLRGTSPDWAPDDSRVAFAVPPDVFASTAIAGYWMKKAGPRDDLMFAGASIFTAPWNAAAGTLGAPTKVLTSDGTTNYYYPAYSPDGSLLVFNYAPSGSNFHNPLARVRVIVPGQASPVVVDLSRLNDDPTVENGAAGRVTNSWARWSPFVQAYKSGRILWLTMSSTRTYGLQILNGGKQNCYPKESPGFVTPDFTTNPTPECTRTQLWMAAIDLDAAAVQAGTDVSHPAFWLPFQDLSTNNHLAQWAQKSFTGTCGGDAGSCGAGLCCDNGGCTATCGGNPPNPQCQVDANCAPGACCVGGACAPCGFDGGIPPQGCSTCLDCSGQACVAGACGSCTNSAQCCAPLQCVSGSCVPPIK